MVEPNPDGHIAGPKPPSGGRGFGYMRRTRLLYPNSMASRRLRFEAMQKLIKPKKEETGE